MSQTGPKKNRCCVPDCTVNSISNPDVILHQFPKDLARLELWKKVLGVSKHERCSRVCSRHFRANQYFDIPSRYRLIYNNPLPQFRVGPLHPIFRDYSPFGYDGYPPWDRDGVVTKLYLNADNSTVKLMETDGSQTNQSHAYQEDDLTATCEVMIFDEDGKLMESVGGAQGTEISDSDDDDDEDEKVSSTLVLTKKCGQVWSVEEVREVSNFLVAQLVDLSERPDLSRTGCTFYGSRLINGGKYFVVCANSFTANLILEELKTPIIQRGWWIFRSRKTARAVIEAFVTDCNVSRTDALRMIEFFNRCKGLRVNEWKIRRWEQSERGVWISIKVPNEDGRIIEHLGSLCFELSQVQFQVKWQQTSSQPANPVRTSILNANRAPKVQQKKRPRSGSGPGLRVVCNPAQLPTKPPSTVEESTSLTTLP